MSKITICQGCYRVMLYENSNAIEFTIGTGTTYVDCCLQCSYNLTLSSNRTYDDIKYYVIKCRETLSFFDPLEYKNKIHGCIGCGMNTLKSHCFECSWRILRTLLDKWMLNIVSEYIDFDEMFGDSGKTLNTSCLTKWVDSRY